MKTTKFLVVLTYLLMIGCSSDGTDTQTTNPDNPDNDVSMDDTTNSSPPSDDISKLVIINIGIAGPGERVEITRDVRATFFGNQAYRNNTNLNLKDEDIIISMVGRSYNRDGSFPTKAEDMFEAYKSDDKTPNVTISGVNTEKENSNSYFLVKESMILDRATTIEFGNVARKITKGDFVYVPTADNLLDSIQKADPDLISFEYIDEVIDDENYNSVIKDRESETTSSDELASLFNQVGDTIWFKTIEIGIVNGQGERLDLIQPDF